MQSSIILTAAAKKLPSSRETSHFTSYMLTQLALLAAPRGHVDRLVLLRDFPGLEKRYHAVKGCRSVNRREGRERVLWSCAAWGVKGELGEEQIIGLYVSSWT